MDSQLLWARFFELRRRLVIAQRIVGVPFVLAFIGAEAAILSLPVVDASRTMALGIDPLIAVGGATAVGCLASYAVGAAFTRTAFRLWKPATMAALEARQGNFYARIARNRANVAPSAANFSGPRNDFHGDHIRSVAGYRSWLRLQRSLVRSRALYV